MPDAASMKRSDWILMAFRQYIETHRVALDEDKTLQRVLVQINMDTSAGRPRAIRCNYENEEKFFIPENRG